LGERNGAQSRQERKHRKTMQALGMRHVADRRVEAIMNKARGRKKGKSGTWAASRRHCQLYVQNVHVYGRSCGGFHVAHMPDKTQYYTAGITLWPRLSRNIVEDCRRRRNDSPPGTHCQALRSLGSAVVPAAVYRSMSITVTVASICRHLAEFLLVAIMRRMHKGLILTAGKN
jgi:hypothetical protein